MTQRILFITNRNIVTTCGELRLIKNRAEVLFSQYGVVTDFLALTRSERMDAECKEVINAGGSLSIIKQDAKKPVSILWARRQLKNEIKKRIKLGRYTTVILSGAGIPSYSKFIKKINDSVKIYVDSHGSSEDILELAKTQRIKKRLFYRIVFWLDKFGYWKAAKYTDGYFVVTNALKEYLRKRYKIGDKSDFVIAPCATTNSDEQYYSNYNRYRYEYREKYNIGVSTKVFIYSGGVSAWQCIEETIALYREIKKEVQDVKMLIFSHNKEAIKKIIGDDSDIIVDSYRPEELRKALCAGDYAFLLRKDCITNNVAFPNKFLEYVQSGMRIIATPYVVEIARQIEKNDIGVLYKLDGNYADIIADINSVHKKDWKITQKILCDNSFETTLHTFTS